MSQKDGGTRLTSAAQTAQTSWHIHDITRDFELEDVWGLPASGGPNDFPRLVELLASFDPSTSSSKVVRALFALRFKLGDRLGWDRADAGLGARVPSIRERLPADLRAAPDMPDHSRHGFTPPLYQTHDEWAVEIANRTVHGILHLGWVSDAASGYRGQMAVYVKRNGLLGTLYMAGIKPFRYTLVYPALLRQLAREWHESAGQTAPKSVQ